jgi:SAM-dependent methyltransferase
MTGGADGGVGPEFQDYFSGDSASYARFRPSYPAALFAWLAGLVARRELAWDAGTGSGQAALGLAGHFRRVLATDASAAQLREAPPHPSVAYRQLVAGADTGLEAGSVDLAVTAQALHWFDRDAYFAEVRRVLRPDGALAVWSYAHVAIAPEVDEVVRHFYRETVGPWWPPDRTLVEEGYRSIALPFPEVEAPSFAMESDWTLAQLAGYIGTWSAVRRCRADTGQDPMPALLRELLPAWGGERAVRRVRWPLTLRVARPGGG